MEPLISMVHPNFNHATLLPSSIDGVLAQTYPNWELIIVDDGSTDNSWEILTQYARRDPRIRVEKLARNVGINRAVAHGMRLCRGDLFCPRASDVPIVSATFFEKAVSGLRQHPEAAVIFGLTNGVNAEGKVVASWGWPSERTAFVSPEQGVKEFFLSDYIAGESTILSWTHLQRHGPYDPQLGPWQDLYLNEALAALYGGIFIDEVITHGQLDANSYSRRQSMTAMVEFAARMEKKFRELPLKVSPKRDWIVHYRERKLSQALLHAEQQSLANTLDQLVGNLGGWPVNRQPGYMASLRANLKGMAGVIREESQGAVRTALALYEEIAGPIPDA